MPTIKIPPKKIKKIKKKKKKKKTIRRRRKIKNKGGSILRWNIMYVTNYIICSLSISICV
jgi:hypothetical protein